MTTNVRRALFTRIWVEHPHAYHGLGVGSPSLLADYPWYSADALTWDYQGIFWRTDGDTDKWASRRKAIRQLLALENRWQTPPVQMMLPMNFSQTGPPQV